MENEHKNNSINSKKIQNSRLLQGKRTQSSKNVQNNRHARHKRYKILIIDDSALMRSVVSDIIRKDDRFIVADTAADGLEGLEMLVSNNGQYDIVLLDVNMPKMSGLEVLKSIDRYKLNCKVIMISALYDEGAKETILALEMGALDFVHKPTLIHGEEKYEFDRKLMEALQGVIYNLKGHHKPKQNTRYTLNTAHNRETISSIGNFTEEGTAGKKQEKLVAIASSTGGPKTLKEIIPKLPKELDAPVVIVQHMPAGFTLSLAERLNELSAVRVKEASDGEELRKGYVYIAPGGRHIRLAENSGRHVFKITDEPAIDGLRPCANIMYESVINTSYKDIICVVLTGMGADGTKGIKSLSKSKEIHVIAQDASTSVVYGMPRAVAGAGLADEIQPLEKISGAIIKNVGVLSDGR